MVSRCAILSFVLISAATAQPLPQLAEYPAHARAGAVEIGAKYLPNGAPAGPDLYASKNLLVVEVAVFPLSKTATTISKSQFRLSVDDKLTLAPASGASTASGPLAAARDSSTEGAVELGGPPITHVGGKQDVQSEMPRRPIALDPESNERSPAPPRKTELPQGVITKPVTGYLFFRFDGDSKSIHSLALTYSDGSVRAKIRIL